MKHSSMSDYDVDVIPMVEYFNSVCRRRSANRESPDFSRGECQSYLKQSKGVTNNE